MIAWYIISKESLVEERDINVRVPDVGVGVDGWLLEAHHIRDGAKHT
jgi:hypothetical protein